MKQLLNDASGHDRHPDDAFLDILSDKDTSEHQAIHDYSNPSPEELKKREEESAKKLSKNTKWELDVPNTAFGGMDVQ